MDERWRFFKMEIKARERSIRAIRKECMFSLTPPSQSNIKLMNILDEFHPRYGIWADEHLKASRVGLHTNESMMLSLNFWFEESWKQCWGLSTEVRVKYFKVGFQTVYFLPETMREEKIFSHSMKILDDAIETGVNLLKGIKVEKNTAFVAVHFASTV